MSLNDIQFPPPLIADLYRRSIIEIDAEKNEVTETPSPVKLNPGFLGNNAKNILVVVDYKRETFLPDPVLEFLTNMLSACKLSLSDVAIVNMGQGEDTDYKQLLATLKSRIVFLFGIEPSAFGLPVSFPHFQIQPYANATFLYAPALDDCNTDPLLKSKLWVCLRRIFAI